ncbi:NUDIX domain-containing protein [Sporosarcina sp. HYO08]|uniref:NUDIX hydrolase n=1 Tax=Sporosarcina sp. HYO08 TaxID=1759557 RepID=UPI00079667EB|nr:NUDIX domain-containing protein [Sporosarcina sp. HYO08]KXH86776.1 NUDIX hydrolase [Sporosarcina sp. HYO08]
MELKRKVLAYITKGDTSRRKILVFEQKEHPEAGLQVPGGTIEDDEFLIDALYREIEEETGLTRDELVLNGKVSKTKFYPKNKDIMYERTIFHLAYTGSHHERDWEHKVDRYGKDHGRTFVLHWVPIDQCPELAAGQDQAIEFIQ